VKAFDVFGTEKLLANEKIKKTILLFSEMDAEDVDDETNAHILLDWE